ncbi:MAG: hypothetical protein O7D34_02975 [Ignavibacteria bacterium]|nr:hypothetical protein [Ignavibacteria bacterium]
MPLTLIANLLALVASLFLSFMPNLDIWEKHQKSVTFAYLLGIAMSLLLIIADNDEKVKLSASFFGIFCIGQKHFEQSCPVS